MSGLRARCLKGGSPGRCDATVSSWGDISLGLQSSIKIEGRGGGGGELPQPPRKKDLMILRRLNCSWSLPQALFVLERGNVDLREVLRPGST